MLLGACKRDIRLLQLLLVATAFLPSSVTGFSTGAVSCVGGEPAIGALQQTADLVYSGSLRELTYDLHINGESVVNRGGEPLPLIETNTDYVIEIRGSLARFREALVRVATTANVLVELTPGENAVVADACEGLDGVVGITHTDASVKKTLSGVLRVSDPTDSLSLDVTVVSSNNDDYLVFGYDSLTLTVVDVVDPNAPPIISTEGPTMSPTEIAEDTTIKPTGGPTAAATSSPTGMPTLSPVASPTASPTVIATAAPVTATPTSDPSVAPVTETPAVVPAVAPVTSAPTAPIPTSPPVTAAPVDLDGTTLQTHSLENLQLGFTNVIELSVDERFQWEELTTKWFEAYFAESSSGSNVVPGTMQTIIHAQSSFLDEGTTDGFLYFVEYNQELTYRSTSDEEQDDPFRLATMPFLNATHQYLASLVEELWHFRDADSVVGPMRESPMEDSNSSDRIAESGIIWIVVVLFIVVCCGGFIWATTSTALNNNATDNIPDTFSFMGSVGGSKRFSADAMSLRSYGTAKESSKKYMVHAPAGKLLLVLEVEDNGSAPTVKSIQEDSPLMGKIDIGDYLVAVDEVDVRGKSAKKVSKLIANRTANAVRKLTLIRGEIVSNEIESVVAESIGDDDESVQELNDESLALSDDDEDFLGGRGNL